jgi:hypothetical protein
MPLSAKLAQYARSNKQRGISSALSLAALGFSALSLGFVLRAPQA